MDPSDHNLMVSSLHDEAHPETMDFLSNAWCNFALQALESKLQDGSSIPVRESTMKMFDHLVSLGPLNDHVI